jgi:hypothetical protein
MPDGPSERRSALRRQPTFRLRKSPASFQLTRPDRPRSSPRQQLPGALARASTGLRLVRAGARPRAPQRPRYRDPVDKVDDKVWRSCGPDCGEMRLGRACESVWRSLPVLHRASQVIHIVLHTGIDVTNGPIPRFPHFPQDLLLLLLPPMPRLISTPVPQTGRTSTGTLDLQRGAERITGTVGPKPRGQDSRARQRVCSWRHSAAGVT